MTAVRRSTRPLEILREAKVADLLGDQAERPAEPSGVCAHDDAYYVIFDDSAAIARITDLSGPSEHNILLATAGGYEDYEDITFDPLSGHFFVLIEAIERAGTIMAVAQEHDANGDLLSAAYLDFPLERSNKGLEGLSCLQRDGQTYLLGLCEGNRCKGGAAGRKPGGGRIQVFARSTQRWEHAGTIRLPKGVAFVDYASVAVSGDRIAVVSQESSAVWVGTLDPAGFDILDGGAIYEFPRDGRGRTTYCSVEGITWAGDHLVAVSDRASTKRGEARCAGTQQSIHVVAIPHDRPQGTTP